MGRPFISYSIDQLEAALFDARQASDHAKVTSIADELTHRRMPRARELLRSIREGDESHAKVASDQVSRNPPKFQKSTGTASGKRKQTPTSEQRRAIDLFKTGGSLKVNAYAGTGKTSTLELLAHSTSRRGQYIAFNRSIVAEARERFPASVDCSTTHGLAFRSTSSAYRENADKMTGKTSANQLAELLGLKKLWRIDENHALQPRSQAYLILETIKRFAQSADGELSVDHIPRHGSLLSASEAVIAEVSNFALQGASYVWGRMLDPADPLPLGHDGYLKLWALSRPEIAADFILLDEAQDTNPVVLEVLRSQAAQMVYVGDRYQQIYEWRGAVNAMERIETDAEARLTQSFRFGQSIAAGASSILALLGEQQPLTGNPNIRSRIGPVEPRTILARTNSSAMTALIEVLNDNRQPHLVGGTGEIMQLLKGVQDLKQGRPTDVPDFFGFTNWEEVVAFADTAEGEQLQTFVNLVESRGERQLMWALNRVVDEDKSDVIISTAHKAKGREWDNVRLMDDFLKSRPRRPPASTQDNDADNAAELRLLYVAVTRAKLAVELPEAVARLVRVDAPMVDRRPAIERPVQPTTQKPTSQPWGPPKDWTPGSEIPSVPRQQAKAASATPPKSSLLGWLFGR